MSMYSIVYSTSIYVRGYVSKQVNSFQNPAVRGSKVWEETQDPNEPKRCTSFPNYSDPRQKISKIRLESRSNLPKKENRQIGLEYIVVFHGISSKSPQFVWSLLS